MKTRRVQWMLLLGGLELLWCLQIPKDVEILEGYEFEDSPEEYYGGVGGGIEANYYEVHSLNNGFNKAIRNRRSTKDYEAILALNKKARENLVNKLTTSTSTPSIDSSTTTTTTTVNPIQSKLSTTSGTKSVADFNAELATPVTPVIKKAKMELRSNDLKWKPIESKMELDTGVEIFPRAEKQIMDPDYDYYSQRPLTSSSGWKTIDSGEAGGDQDNAEDTVAVATSNYGASITGGAVRQARVNFVTQQQQNQQQQQQQHQPQQQQQSRRDRLDESILHRHAATYPFQPQDRYSERMMAKIVPPQYDYKYSGHSAPISAPYPGYEMYPSRSYDPYLRRYDR